MTHQNTLLKKKIAILRLDVLPWIFIYIAFFHFGTNDEIYSKLMTIGLVLLHCVCFLTNFWSVRANALIQYFSLSTNKKSLLVASHVKVRSAKKGRNTIYAICPLERSTIDDREVFHFHFHNKKYIWEDKLNDFKRIKPQVDETIKFYKDLHKMPTDELSLYDKNTFSIPAPEFKTLLRDQLIEPFSFFQFFSVGLWLLDENRIYPMITLFMIFMSSCIVTFQRMRTMQMLRKMIISPQYIYVYQNHKWVKISSAELKPGDICAIQTSNAISVVEAPPQDPNADLTNQIPFARFLSPEMKENIQRQMQARQQAVAAATQKRTKEAEENQKVLPCDFLVLSGTCVVNESILTGESIPQIKDSIDMLDDDKENLDIKNKHKNSILFCGTEVIQTFTDQKKLPANIQTKPPIPCVIGYALRTGFETAKGIDQNCLV